MLVSKFSQCSEIFEEVSISVYMHCEGIIQILKMNFNIQYETADKNFTRKFSRIVYKMIFYNVVGAGVEIVD